MAGFLSPLFLFGLSASSGQAGFRSVLPVPQLAGGGEQQAGFIGPIPILNLGGRAVAEAVYEPLGGPSDGIHLADEDIIMFVARAFLTMVNQ